MSLFDVPADDSREAWAKQLHDALARGDRTVVLADMDDKDAVVQTKCVDPKHLLYIARDLVQQAFDAYEEIASTSSDSEEEERAETMTSVCDEILAMLPDPHAEPDDEIVDVS